MTKLKSRLGVRKGPPQGDDSTHYPNKGDRYDYFGETWIVERIDKKRREVQLRCDDSKDQFGKVSPQQKIVHISALSGATFRKKGYRTKGESFFETCERDEHGHCIAGSGGSKTSDDKGGKGGKESEADESKGKVGAEHLTRGLDAKTAAVVTAIAKNPKTAPPPGKVYNPNVEAKGKHGITKAACVGVPAFTVPPPPKIERLPNLSPDERKVEGEFIDAFEANPDKMAKDFLNLVHKKTKPGDPPTFGTDDAKELTDCWMVDDPQQRAQNRARLNISLHQVANAVAKRAFLQHLDTIKPGGEVLVTVGGCGAGKGFSIKNVPKVLEMKTSSAGVWDSAGDQNATENPWVQSELEKRGLKGTYVFVHADPETQWGHPERGIVKRAQDPNDGRMVDARVAGDSYAIGAQNHQAFYEANKDNPNAKFVFLHGKEELPGIPESALNLDRHELKRKFTEILAASDAPPHVKDGGTKWPNTWPDEVPAKGEKRLQYKVVKKVLKSRLPSKGYKRVNANPGDRVIWNSKTGPVEAEYRGQTMGMDGYEATIIVREEGSSPFQITVDADQIRSKSLKKTHGHSVNDAHDLLQSVLRRLPAGYGISLVEQEAKKYQLPDDTTYWEVISTTLDRGTIEREVEEASARKRNESSRRRR